LSTLRRPLPLLSLATARALAATGVLANCLDFGGFAIFQCANYSHFAPLPAPVTSDPNGNITNISAAFWQIGFGNRTLTLTGSSGTGMVGPVNFAGNDSGVFSLDLKDARVATANLNLPPGSTCLSSNNWANFGVDGCIDNVRDATLPFSDDGVLNPYYDFQYARYGYPGEYSLKWQQDYPMAVLLRGPAIHVACNHSPICAGPAPLTCNSGPRAGQPCATESDCDFCSGGASANAKCSGDGSCADGSLARYFAVAAVATLNRHNDGTGHNGPCASVNPGTNPAPCDPRSGYYDFHDIVNGLTNPASGSPDVIPWQQAPTPQLTCVSGCSGLGSRTIDASWAPVVLYHDGSVRPSTNPKLAPADPTRAPGVGVLDVAAKFPLIRYQLESAPVSCANVDANDVVQPATMAWSSVGPETASASVANCRVGQCGDIGYDADAGSIRTPTAVGIVDIQDLPGGGLRYVWDDQGPTAGLGTHYDVFGGDGPGFPVGDLPAGSCLADHLTTPYFDVPSTDPPATQALYFMIRAHNQCPIGTGTYGSPGHDAGVSQSAQPCN